MLHGDTVRCPEGSIKMLHGDTVRCPESSIRMLHGDTARCPEGSIRIYGAKIPLEQPIVNLTS